MLLSQKCLARGQGQQKETKKNQSADGRGRDKAWDTFTIRLLNTQTVHGVTTRRVEEVIWPGPDTCTLLFLSVQIYCDTERRRRRRMVGRVPSCQVNQAPRHDCGSPHSPQNSHGVGGGGRFYNRKRGRLVHMYSVSVHHWNQNESIHAESVVLGSFVFCSIPFIGKKIVFIMRSFASIGTYR